MRLTVKQIALPAVVCLLAACSSSGDPGDALPSAQAAPQGTPGECEDYPLEAATALITDQGTGQQRLEGEVTKASSVLSPQPGPEGSAVYVIALDLSGKALLMVHPVTETPATPTGDGPYGALSSATEAATGFPQDKGLESLVPGDVVSTAVNCVI